MRVGQAVLDIFFEHDFSYRYDKYPDNKESFQQGYAKAKKEERQLFEKEIKEALEIESDTTGIDLITEIITERTKNAGKKSLKKNYND